MCEVRRFVELRMRVVWSGLAVQFAVNLVDLLREYGQDADDIAATFTVGSSSLLFRWTAPVRASEQAFGSRLRPDLRPVHDLRPRSDIMGANGGGV